ncbi:MAG: TSUP family transporter [Deltaproteobacteria bacterium]|nr:TSUP family transporter [Deltaproteobacteria bacterium]MBI3295890.1 TSUP family transporter [Deltaproteobacteria bacterium]
MLHSPLLLYCVVAALSFVQSIFGVGLLLFGTPLLLVLGYPFEQALSVLLPASLTVSILQVKDGRDHLRPSLKLFAAGLILPTILGLTAALATSRHWNIRTAVGILVFLTCGVRLSSLVRERVGRWARRYEHAFLAGIGIIHGFTNMGGSLLALFCTSRFTEKSPLRAHIALGYLTMVLAQLTVLVISHRGLWGVDTVLYPAISSGVYLSIGNTTFQVSGEVAYQRLFSAFLLAMGALLLCP